MENVKNILSDKHKGVLDKWILLLDDLGYNSYYEVLNGSDYGVPQNRERVIMVSILKEFDKGFAFPEKLELKENLYDILEKNVDKKFYKKPESYDESLIIFDG